MKGISSQFSKDFRFCLLLCPFALAFLLCDRAFGQAHATSPTVSNPSQERMISAMQSQEAYPLNVILTTDKKFYTKGGDITIQVLLMNKSHAPLYLYADLDWGESASFSLSVKNAISGKYVQQEFIADALTPPAGSKEDFVKLLPNHIYGVVLTGTLADFNLKTKGTYDLIVEYHSPIRSDMAFGLPIWGREKGSMSSNRTTITVGD